MTQKLERASELSANSLLPLLLTIENRCLERPSDKSFQSHSCPEPEIKSHFLDWVPSEAGHKAVLVWYVVSQASRTVLRTTLSESACCSILGEKGQKERVTREQGETPETSKGGLYHHLIFIRNLRNLRLTTCSSAMHPTKDGIFPISNYKLLQRAGEQSRQWAAPIGNFFATPSATPNAKSQKQHCCERLKYIFYDSDDTKSFVDAKIAALKRVEEISIRNSVEDTEKFMYPCWSFSKIN